MSKVLLVPGNKIRLSQIEPLKIVNCNEPEKNSVTIAANRAADSIEMTARIFNGNFVKRDFVLWTRKFYEGIIGTTAILMMYDHEFVKHNNINHTIVEHTPLWVRHIGDNISPSCTDESGERGVTPTYESAMLFISNIKPILHKIAKTVKDMVELTGGTVSENLELLLKNISTEPSFDNTVQEDRTEAMRFYKCKGVYYVSSDLNRYFRTDFQLDALLSAIEVKKNELPVDAYPISRVDVINVKSPDRRIYLPCNADSAPSIIDLCHHFGYSLVRQSLVVKPDTSGEQMKINLDVAYRSQVGISIQRTTWSGIGDKLNELINEK